MHTKKQCPETKQAHFISMILPLLPSASEGWGKVMFSVCSPRRGNTPVPGSFQGLWSKVLSRGTPVLAGRGVPLSWLGGYPRTGQGVSPARTGGTPSQDWNGLGYPLPQTGYTAGGMPREVSRRRTFLLVRSMTTKSDTFSLDSGNVKMNQTIQRFSKANDRNHFYDYTRHHLRYQCVKLQIIKA